MTGVELFFCGLAGTYEAEHIARMFFPGAKLVQRRCAPGAPCVRVRRAGARVLCGVRTAQRCGVKVFRLPDGAGPKEEEYEVCRALYMLLQAETGVRPLWGMLTGVRPVRLLHDMRRRGLSPAQQQAFFCRRNDVSEEKYKLAVQIANNQQDVINCSALRSYSLYISIPFCPSRCSYCSFVSTTTEKSGALVAPYLQRLEQELQSIAAMAEKLRLRLETVYIGGGTPTAVSAQQLARLMAAVRGAFDFSHVREFTVEAGRPDCTTPEKLAVIREGGATRISINPQTLSDEVLRAIGRRHSAQDVLDCFAAARKAGHRNINMDLIAGLPLDTPAGFEKSLAGVLALSPENITVHTLTLKRASNLVMQAVPPAYGDVAQMVQHSVCALQSAGYGPYYLYRQKGTLQNLENTGWAKPGFAGLYNIYIMEELHTIFSTGAGGSTKLKAPGGTRIERIFNYKYPAEYIAGFDTILERKKRIGEFYGRYLDPEASC